MSDELIPEDHYLYGRATADEDRLDRARRGLPDRDQAEDAGDPWEALDGDEEREGAAEELLEDEGMDHGGGDAEDEDRRAVVIVSTVAEALDRWAAWYRRGGERIPPVLSPKVALLRPAAPVGASVPFQVAAMVESTPGFVLVERRLRAWAHLDPARDSYPLTLRTPAEPRIATVAAAIGMPLFLASLWDDLPREFLPPVVCGSGELTPAEKASQRAIEAKYQGRYPATWRK